MQTENHTHMGSSHMAGQSRDLLALLSPPLCGMRCRLASVPPEIRKTMLLFIFLKEKKFPVCFSFILFKIGKKHLLCSHVSGEKRFLMVAHL